jgi:hypothetical protein
MPMSRQWRSRPWCHACTAYTTVAVDMVDSDVESLVAVLTSLWANALNVPRV